MTDTPEIDVEAVRAQEAAIALTKAQHDAPRLDRAAELLAQMAPLVDELEAIAPSLFAPHLAVHLRIPAERIRQAVTSVTTAARDNAAVLASA